MLAEGNNIRSIERITEIHRDTIMRLGIRIGEGCQRIMDEKMRGLNCKHIEVDEIWGFIGAKRKNARRVGAYGDVWTFISLDSESKLIPNFIVGKRDMYHARAFMDDLAGRMSSRIQVSTNSLAAYPDAVERGFGSEIDYGQIVKTYSVSVLGKEAASRYSPAEVVKVERTVVTGMPDVRRITTSHIESQNLTLRMQLRTWKRAHGQFPNLLNVVENKQDYLARLKLAVEHLHNCGAVHRSTVPVTEVFRGKTIWQGEVEVFDLNGHPKAKLAYAWSHRAGEGDSDERFVAVLEIPPVASPETAVKIAIAAEVKGKN